MLSAKRLFDIVFSFTVLVIFLPLFILIAVLIKISSKGPVFFRGIRMGKDKNLFSCLKFRTMHPDAKKQLPKLLEIPEIRQEWEVFHKIKNDPRLTRIGKILRKTSLDEIPQFWNVLEGSLSVVGPRPIEIYKIEEAESEIQKWYGSRCEKVLSIKPGITGIWQTCGRNLLTTEEQVVMDEAYIDKQSFLFDLKIICKTIYILLFPKGAF